LMVWMLQVVHSNRLTLGLLHTESCRKLC